MEMNEEIYANAEVAADSSDSEQSYEDGHVNEDNLQTQRTGRFKQSETSVLWIKFNILSTDKTKLETSHNNLTIERDQLQTSYNTLTIEREKLQREREELERFSNKLGWIYFSSSVHSISNESMTWTESRQDCRGRGADLVIINNKEEQEFISKLLGIRKAWIGLNDRDKEEEWKWVDDTRLSTGYWGRGEPNSKAGDEDCVLTGDRSDPVWNWADYPCDDKFIWICEKTIFN
ncbi:C-type lectin domain family 4 member E-like isoform X2 [Hemibagrus wyckioides]|uniref:C-type lectin domain family 4 member E-like isoform X2 n=1 Tax=Hemibagrus wyckioides TaxID=337641 RepID=UPI00266D1A4C|nr:C-type lectin domain family 4 member E-like isoform X2 [Hemibagrus wyckioides]